MRNLRRQRADRPRNDPSPPPSPTAHPGQSHDVADAGRRQWDASKVLLNFLKDIVIGTLCGVLFIVVSSYLVPLRGGRLRTAVFDLIADPGWRESIEENLEVKFIDIEIYEAIKDEIERAPRTVDDWKAYQEKAKELEEERQKLEFATKQYSELVGELGVDLGRWCGMCTGGWGNCEQRKMYLAKAYHMSEKKAQLELMINGNCIKTG